MWLFNWKKPKDDVDKIKSELDELKRDVGSFYNRINDVEQGILDVKKMINDLERNLTNNYYSKDDFNNYRVILKLNQLIVGGDSKGNRFLRIHFESDGTLLFTMWSAKNIKFVGSAGHEITQISSGPWRIT